MKTFLRFLLEPYAVLAEMSARKRRRNAPIETFLTHEQGFPPGDLCRWYEDGAIIRVSDVSWKGETRFNAELRRYRGRAQIVFRVDHARTREDALGLAEDFWRILPEITE